ncbi:hypothetical protein ACOMICROBIO_FLGHMIGD_04279 [Vibrio sp. B1FLJ16]|uniref:cystatin family protein n=1 Tax=Vibrio sp. B1FLJ16 TaxID=2751178 RepID=UPI0015F53B80|nr:cystatin domain-containing protein [Vibrio sp. B1FLJ16]CAD7820964.1 hypothetical protein ACOMICROBIO_FLGHMIGD_04279 [Vibrio sp. B1FLJ16]CAE6944836.1 hypothetical protein ACOMICROBIO_FLGHMIGD_04279 [Vibrio sp. B1FLJ16]
MKLQTVSAVALMVMLVGCQQYNPESTADMTASADVCNAQENVPGGWREFEATPDVQRAMGFVLTKMDTLSSFKQILNVHAQIVSGVNYAIEFEMDDGSVWNTIVYRDLEGNYASVHRPREGKFCEE